MYCMASDDILLKPMTRLKGSPRTSNGRRDKRTFGKDSCSYRSPASEYGCRPLEKHGFKVPMACWGRETVDEKRRGVGEGEGAGVCDVRLRPSFQVVRSLISHHTTHCKNPTATGDGTCHLSSSLLKLPNRSIC